MILIDELIEKYIKKDKQLIGQVKEYIPEYYDGTNHLILAQDILYQTLEKDAGPIIGFFKETQIFMILQQH